MSTSYSSKSINKVLNLMQKLIYVMDLRNQHKQETKCNNKTLSKHANKTQKRSYSLLNLDLNRIDLVKCSKCSSRLDLIKLNVCSKCSINLMSLSGKSKAVNKKYKNICSSFIFEFLIPSLNDNQIANICLFIFISNLIYLLKYHPSF